MKFNRSEHSVRCCSRSEFIGMQQTVLLDVPGRCDLFRVKNSEDTADQIDGFSLVEMHGRVARIQRFQAVFAVHFDISLISDNKSADFPGLQLGRVRYAGDKDHIAVKTQSARSTSLEE